MSYRAVSDRIVLIPDKTDDKIDGILIPDSSKNKPKSGVVESAGPSCREAKPGFRILFLEGHGAIFHEDGVDKIVLREADMLCYRGDQREIILIPGEIVSIHIYDEKDPRTIISTGDNIFDIISKELKSNPSTLIGKFK